jgi:copper resistance protein B
MSTRRAARASAVLLALAIPALLPAQEASDAHQHEPEPLQPAHQHEPPAQENTGHVHVPGTDAPRTPIPVLTEADRAAALPARAGHAAHDDGLHNYLLADRLELRRSGSDTGFAWAAQGWTGSDLHRLWLFTEGATTEGDTEAAEIEVFYGRSVTAWWDLLAGLRHDDAPGPSRDYLALGLRGLAPQWFETRAMAYVGNDWRAGLRLEVEYELLFTNRLILQPLVEVQFWSKDDVERGLGSGLSTAEAGLRLRYEITRRFAPYVGLSHEHAFGNTADLHREATGRSRETWWVAGIRVWF